MSDLLLTPLPYGQDDLLAVDPHRIASWIGNSDTTALTLLGRYLRDKPNCTRTEINEAVRQADRWTSIPPIKTVPHRPSTKPPYVAPRDHATIERRMTFQARGGHLPYARAGIYDMQVPANKWARTTLRAFDDPFKLASGDGLVINQDGLWTLTVKVDWSLGHAEVVSSAAQATRVMVNGSDVGLRDYLDDDAYSIKAPINTLTWTDTFRAGTTLNVDIRSEGLGTGYTAVANVYVRLHLVRVAEDGFDMEGFPLPPDPEPIPETPLGGYCGPNDHQPTYPRQPNTCNDRDYAFTFTISDGGQVGSYRCVNGQLTTVWSAYGWDGGQYYGGGVVGGDGSSYGPGRPSYSGGW
ncbi:MULTISPECIES: hypothetical protein [Nonomuraea]|uniref:hypothetical protein n=1 Tax=Nonomuraea TaxID=83681 RepID=UPI0012FC89FC|nr:hypothetical protein [Nonomuraea typhae]